MKNYSTILTGAAGLAAVLAIATPAAAQSYPYGSSNRGIVGAIINSMTGGGYGQYPMGNYGYGQVNERTAVNMCAAAAEQRLNGSYRGQPGYGYNNGYASNGYQNGYGYNYNGQGARVLGITNVERRNGGSLKVSGVANSGRAYGGQGGYYGQGAYANQSADLRFNCKVNTRGQVTDVNISRNRVAYRGY